MAMTLNSLNPQQREAATFGDGPLLIVAGAGTGKTTVITQRIGHLIEQEQAKTHEILALTFTEKAAEEMEERVDKLLPYGYVDLWISTFHAFAEKILQKHGIEIGLPDSFRLLNQTDQWLLVRQNLDKFNLDYYKPLGNPTKFIHAMIKLFSRAKDEAIGPEVYLEYVENLKLNADGADFLQTMMDKEQIETLNKKEQKEVVAQEILKSEEIANAYHVYQQLLHENDALDFGDLITYCLQLFRKRPAILAKYRQQFKYILIDEFQDTNHAQYELIQLLATPKNNITVVGDDDQSVYKFRGASVSNILEFKKDYPKSKEIFLTQNYRSSQNILDLSYKFIQQNNPDRLEVKLAKASGKKLSKKLKAHNVKPGTIEHLHFATSHDEVQSVLKKIIDLKQKDKDTAWSDFAILARTNDAANQFLQGLRQTKIPYYFFTSRGLYTQGVVADVLAYLRLLDDYHESSAVYRILNSPIVGLSAMQVSQITYWAKRKGYSLFHTLRQAEIMQQQDKVIQAKIEVFLKHVAKHSQLAREQSVGKVVLAFLEETGYLKLLTNQTSLEAIQATGYLNQFYKKITDFEQSAEQPSVKLFLELIQLELEAGDTGSLRQDVEEGPDAVKVMTIHAAKGLEFTNVFIVNLVDRRFPIDDRKDPISLPDALIKEILPEGDSHLQEERRLFYVAMTRAKRGLYLTSASDYGGMRRKKISRFLSELQKLGFSLHDANQAIAGDPAELYKLDSGQSRPISQADLERMLPKKFSFTQLRSFENCPYHYWLEYILKIPQPGKSVFSFGSSMHITLQKFFELVRERGGSSQQDLFGQSKQSKDKALVSQEELLAIYKSKWIDDWYQSRDEHDKFFARGKKALREFYDSYQKELPQPKFLEQSFNLPISAGKHSYTITGKIDRIDALNKGVEIIDYKTGQTKTLSTVDKQQLLIYQLAAQEVLHEQVEQLTFYYLESGKQLSFVGNDKQLEAIKKKVLDIIQKIRTTKFPLASSACKCRTPQT